ncbi:MAG: hypothetical protein GOVbin2700_18 [Prokaryotic dsDNA virus sp.]|nr:MAG: hypothetical protein GOVbin2700_18 [Prokaryotic dsDNA virus sp.]
MSTLFGTKIKDTYDGLLKVSDNVGITSTKKIITDGLGNDSSVYISSEDFQISTFFYVDINSGTPASSKIGLGTSSPTTTLHIVGDLRLTARFYDSNNSTGTSNQVLSSTGSGTDWVTLSEIGGVDGTGVANKLAYWLDTETLTYDNLLHWDSSNNRLGVGTATPQTKLEVNGSFRVSSGNEKYLDIDDGGYVYKIGDIDGGEGNSYLEIDSNNSESNLYKSTLGIPTYIFHQGNTTTKFGFSTTDTFVVRTNDVERFSVNNSGVALAGGSRVTTILDEDDMASDSNTALATQQSIKAFVESEIAAVPSGLNFQGNWNADTNSPTLASGTGTVGHFYNVSTPGSTNLDGETDWKIGDWAVFVEAGGTDKWMKIDNTSVLSGVGSANKIAYWSNDSTLTYDTDFYVDGDTIFTTNLEASNNIVSGNNIHTGSGGKLILFANDDNYITYNSWYIWTGSDVIIRNSGSGSFKFQTNGANDVLTLDSSQNVGIGTTSPGEKLTVAGKIEIKSGNWLILRNSDNSNYGSIRGASDTSNDVTINTNAEVIRFKQSGLVGIGTTSPSKKLDVEGNIRAINTAGSSASEIDITSGATWRLRSNPTSGDNLYGLDIIKGSAGTDIKMQFDSNGNATFAGDVQIDGGNLGIGTAPTSRNLSVFRSTAGSVANFLHYTDASNFSGLYIDVSQDSDIVTINASGSSGAAIDFQTGNNSVLFINTSQNVGIGTTSPTSSLDIFKSGNASLRVKANGSATITIDSDADDSGTSGSYLHYRDTGATKWTLYKETNNDFYLYNASATTYPIHAKAGGDIVLMEDGNNLGVGNSSPTYKLSVSDDTDGAVNIFQLRNGDTTYSQSFSYVLDTSKNLVITGASGAGGVRYNVGTNGFTIAGGDVGIGTTSPGQKLEVAGRIRVTTDPTIEFYEASNKRGGIQWDATNDYTNIFAVGGNIRFDIGGEKALITSTTATFSGDITTTGSSITIDPPSGDAILNLTHSSQSLRIDQNSIRTTTNSHLSLMTNHTLALYIDTSQNVGIGTTSPDARLDVLTTATEKYVKFRADNGEERFKFYVGASGNASSLYMYDNDGTSNNVKLSSGGDSWFVNNLGIGTTSPNDKLEVADSSAPNIRMYRSGTGQVWQHTIDSSGRYMLREAASSGGTLYTRFQVDDTGEVAFPSYGSGTFTGTATQRLAVDSSGNIIEVPIGSGAVDGSGTTGYITKWTDSDTIGDSIISSSGTNVTIATNNDYPILQLLRDGDNPSTNQLLGRIQFMADYGGSHQNWGRIELDTNASATRTDMDFYVKSTGGSELLTMKLNGTADAGGNVIVYNKLGIGETSIDAKLHISDGATANIKFERPGHSKWAFGIPDGQTYLAFDETNDGLTTPTMVLTKTTKRVGIGTTSPGGNLHVVGASGGAGQIYLSDVDNGSGTGDSLLISKSGTSAFIYNRDSGNISFGTNDTSNYLNITNTGNIGIGTTSPSYKLDINGGAIFLDSDWPLYLGSTNAFIEGNSSGTIVRINASAGFKVTDGGDTRFDIDTNGNATFDGSIDIRGSGYGQIKIATNLTADTNKQSGIYTENYEGNNVSIFQTFQQNGNNTIYYGSADGAYAGMQNHRFYVNADSDTAGSGHTQALHIASNTNATFGGSVTLTPASGHSYFGSGTSKDLNINAGSGLVYFNNSGTTTFAGSVDATNYKINGAQGSDGQVLTSTGSGVAWETPSGGGGTIDGSGTANTVTMWSDSDTLTDAPITISSNDATFSGQITLNGTDGHINLDSNNAIVFDNTNNNNAYYIRNGGTNIATMQWGTGTPGGNIKMVLDGSGNLGIGTTSPSKQLMLYGDTPFIRLEDNQGGNKRLDLWVDSNAVAHIDANQSASQITLRTASTDRLRITNAGLVGIGTASPENKLHILTSDTDATQQLLIQNNSTGDAAIKFNISGDTYSVGIDNSDDDKFKISKGDLGTNDRFTIDEDGNATFAGDISNASGHFTISSADDFNVDATGQINLDADGGNIRFKDGGTHYGTLRQDSSHFIIEASTADKDIILRGTDDTTEIDALRLDMSNGGNATFSGTITSGNITTNSRITFDYGGDHYLESGTNTWNFKNSGGTNAFQINHSDQSATFSGALNMGASKKIYLGGSDSRMHIYHTGSGGEAVVLTKEGDLSITNQSDGDNIIIKTENDSGTATTMMTFDGSQGNIHTQVDFRIYDDKKLQLGNGADLEIYHESNNSYISNSTGDLIIRCDSDDIKILAEDDVVIRDNDDSTEMAKFINGGAVELYHNGNKKIETTSSGVDVSGGLYVDTGIYHNGDTNNYIYFSTDTQKFYTSGSERMRIDSSGRVGIGTTSLTEAFVVSGNIELKLNEGMIGMNVGDTWGDSDEYCHYGLAKPNGAEAMMLASYFGLKFGTNGSERLEIAQNGKINCGAATRSNTTSSFANMYMDSTSGEIKRSTSSRRYKTNIVDYTKGLDEVLQLQPKTYNDINGDSKQFAGLIAEDVHDLGLNEYVYYNENNEPDALGYSHMIALLTNAIKELKQENDDLKARVSALEK